VRLAEVADAIILLDQVDLANTGVVTERLLGAVVISTPDARLLLIADSRRGPRAFRGGVQDERR
jgi:hypothetical protein